MKKNVIIEKSYGSLGASEYGHNFNIESLEKKNQLSHDQFLDLLQKKTQNYKEQNQKIFENSARNLNIESNEKNLDFQQLQTFQLIENLSKIENELFILQEKIKQNVHLSKCKLKSTIQNIEYLMDQRKIALAQLEQQKFWQTETKKFIKKHFSNTEQEQLFDLKQFLLDSVRQQINDKYINQQRQNIANKSFQSKKDSVPNQHKNKTFHKNCWNCDFSLNLSHKNTLLKDQKLISMSQQEWEEHLKQLKIKIGFPKKNPIKKTQNELKLVKNQQNKKEILENLQEFFKKQNIQNPEYSEIFQQLQIDEVIQNYKKESKIKNSINETKKEKIFKQQLGFPDKNQTKILEINKIPSVKKLDFNKLSEDQQKKKNQNQPQKKQQNLIDPQYQREIKKKLMELFTKKNQVVTDDPEIKILEKVIRKVDKYKFNYDKQSLPQSSLSLLQKTCKPINKEKYLYQQQLIHDFQKVEQPVLDTIQTNRDNVDNKQLIKEQQQQNDSNNQEKQLQN